MQRGTLYSYWLQAAHNFTTLHGIMRKWTERLTKRARSWMVSGSFRTQTGVWLDLCMTPSCFPLEVSRHHFFPRAGDFLLSH